MKFFLDLLSITTLLFLANIVSATSDTPQQRSIQLIKGWKSKECQNYRGKPYFSTIEDYQSCNNKEILPCPSFKMHKEFISWSDLKRWPCRDMEHIDKRGLLISHTHKFIFVNNPKVGSSTLSLLFNKLYALPVREYSALHTIPEKDFDDYFIFTFVREPVLRMESGISEARKYDSTYETRDFLHLMDNGCIMNHHVFSQVKMLKVKNPYTGKDIEFDFIGSLAHYDEDVSYLTSLLNKPPNGRRMALQQKSAFEMLTIPFLNRGAANIHSLLDYSDPEVKKEMCAIVDQDSICFPSVSTFKC